MSGTTAAPATIWTPQTIIALLGMAIVGGTVGTILAFGDPQTKAQTVGGVLSMGAAIIGFYFGSSKGSQDKDATIAAKPPTGTSTP